MSFLLSATALVLSYKADAVSKELQSTEETVLKLQKKELQNRITNKGLNFNKVLHSLAKKRVRDFSDGLQALDLSKFDSEYKGNIEELNKCIYEIQKIDQDSAIEIQKNIIKAQEIIKEISVDGTNEQLESIKRTLHKISYMNNIVIKGEQCEELDNKVEEIKNAIERKISAELNKGIDQFVKKLHIKDSKRNRSSSLEVVPKIKTIC